ncbi:MAG TPA: CocE/NonD family hydrolase C-terminal non-catalytic domain-containing protein, partial [Actinomycetota bacterium]|nr:CocE/NonD family hydrolase C-terminal non-catalytic domain-containing protein [Actinomycetota bacterium]
ATCREHDAVDGNTGNGAELPYRFCDDGPADPVSGDAGIPVPGKYHETDGDDYTGLPAPGTADEVAEAESQDDIRAEDGNRVTIDVDISLPPVTMTPPPEGFPIIAMNHGFAETKGKWEAPTIDGSNPMNWHMNNAWLAARGYVVINSLARGHINADDQGSGGTLQLNSRRYEANDLQYLIALLADHDLLQADVGQVPMVNVNPLGVAVHGGSYGGWLTWLLGADPVWRSPKYGAELRTRVIVPRYTATDLLESLVPGGHFFERHPKTNRPYVAPTEPAEAISRSPIGVAKLGIVAGFYSYGLRFDTDHVVFPRWAHMAVARLLVGEPYEGDTTLESAVTRLIEDSSVYYQGNFWKKVERGLRIPIFAPQGITDPLFPANETIRIYNKLKSLAPGYPITMYFGDFDHVTAQNKLKEYADLCGDDRHPCTVADYRLPDGSLDLRSAPATLSRRGINSRVSDFLDHYLQDPSVEPPAYVAASTTVCPANATEQVAADEPGLEYRAPSWRHLTSRTVTLTWREGGTLTNAAPDPHGIESDPIVRSRDARIPKCYTTNQSNPGPGVIRYESAPMTQATPIIGIPRLRLDYATPSNDYWLAARLYDLDPDGNMTLITRGICRVNTSAAKDRTCDMFDLFGVAWLMETDHAFVVEISQSDSPFLRKDNIPSSVTVTAADLTIPVTPAKFEKDPRI